MEWNYWIVTRSPITWWEIGAVGASDFTFTGPGFTGAAQDPTIYVMRGMSYAFDNSTNAGTHPFRIQSTQGLSGTAYTAGQTGSGTAVLYFTVPMDAPAHCITSISHAAMNGTINVVS